METITASSAYYLYYNTQNIFLNKVSVILFITLTEVLLMYSCLLILFILADIA